MVARTPSIKRCRHAGAPEPGGGAQKRERAHVESQFCMCTLDRSVGMLGYCYSQSQRVAPLGLAGGSGLAASWLRHAARATGCGTPAAPPPAKSKHISNTSCRSTSTRISGPTAPRAPPSATCSDPDRERDSAYGGRNRPKVSHAMRTMPRPTRRPRTLTMRAPVSSELTAVHTVRCMLTR